MPKRKKMKKSTLVLLIGFALCVILNVTAVFSTQFSDFYVQKIFPIISFPLMAISSVLPISLGEILIIIAVLLIVLGIPSLIVFLIVKRKNKKQRRKVLTFTYKFVLWVLLFVFATETLNCFIMYRCSTFSSRYFSETEHTEELLLDTLEAVASEVKNHHFLFERDGEGYIVLENDLRDECIEAMKKASSSYSQLKGFYPNPKPIMNSFFMSQAGTIGLYMPFTMEATYNRDTQDIAKPSTICHELSHLKGIIQEDEANFVSMVACFNSDSPEVRYSGYLDALYYLYADAKKLIGTEYEEEFREIISTVPEIVWEKDISSFKADYFEKNEHKEIIPTETVEVISETFTDTTLQLNGVSDGIMSYFRVVELLMDYYASGNNVWNQ